MLSFKAETEVNCIQRETRKACFKRRKKKIIDNNFLKINPLIMNAKILYDTILQLVFTTFLLLTLFSFIVLKDQSVFDANNEDDADGTQLIDAPPKADPLLAKGKGLFKTNCASCHNKNLADDMTGPALKGVNERWADYPKEDLYKWIRNSQLMITEGHPKAKALFAEYKSIMNAFPNLTDDEIAAMLYFIDKAG